MLNGCSEESTVDPSTATKNILQLSSILRLNGFGSFNQSYFAIIKVKLVRWMTIIAKQS